MRSRTLVAALIAACLASVLVVAQTPVNFMNAGLRVDNNGNLMVAAGAFTAPQGPVTNAANLGVKVDSAGQLMVTLAGGTGQALFADGTAPLPSIAFASEPTLGFWRNGAANVTLQGTLNTTANVVAVGNVLAGSGAILGMSSRFQMTSAASGAINVMNAGATIGSQLKVDALPTIASGFGAVAPAIVAGSTPLAGAVNVGTGAVATSGVVNFNGTAFPSAPFCLCSDQTTVTAGVCKAAASTTQLTITTTVAATASDQINWLCISSK